MNTTLPFFPSWPPAGGLSLVPVGQPRGFAAGAGHEPETGAGAPVSRDPIWKKLGMWQNIGKWYEMMANIWEKNCKIYGKTHGKTYIYIYRTKDGGREKQIRHIDGTVILRSLKWSLTKSKRHSNARSAMASCHPRYRISASAAACWCQDGGRLVSGSDPRKPWLISPKVKGESW